MNAISVVRLGGREVFRHRPWRAVVERQPFALTDAQYHDLAAMKPATRDMHLRMMAYAHEYEQRRRIYHGGAPFLMPMDMELALAKQWATIAEEREGEARAAFDNYQPAAVWPGMDGETN